MVTTKSVVNYKFCSGQGGRHGQGKLLSWVLSWVLSLPLPWLALGGMLLSVVGYAGVLCWMVMAGGGLVAMEPVYTTSKKRNIVMTVSDGCMPYSVTRWRWASLADKP